MDVFKLLEKDHQKVSGLFKKVENSKGATREKLFTELEAELTVHAEVEEKIFYPRLEEEEETKDMILEAREEHRLVEQLVAELSSMEKTSEQWDAKLKVLKEMVEHHVDEEESELFPKAKKVLEKGEAAELAESIESEKQELLKGQRTHKGASRGR